MTANQLKYWDLQRAKEELAVKKSLAKTEEARNIANTKQAEAQANKLRAEGQIAISEAELTKIINDKIMENKGLITDLTRGKASKDASSTWANVAKAVKDIIGSIIPAIGGKISA